jgi:CheY-like chemotaxis protein
MNALQPEPHLALIVEDDPDVRALAAVLLEETRLDVVEVESAEAALDCLQERVRQALPVGCHGNSRAGLLPYELGYEQTRQLQAPPVSTSDHRPCRLAVLPVPLSLRLVEEMLLERGIVVSYETIRRWGKKFGPKYARRLRRKQPSPGDVWLRSWKVNV